MPTWLTIIITIMDLIIAAAAVWGIGKRVEKRVLENHDAEQQRDADIKEALDGVRALPGYRDKSKEIQAELKANDTKLLETCEKIQKGVDRNCEMLNERLDKLEAREKNAIREKLLNQHRIFTSKIKNPMQAWSEMERDSFFLMVKDYESLGGNDYVHSVVIPAMNKLHVVHMSDLKALEELMHSRQA